MQRCLGAHHNGGLLLRPPAAPSAATHCPGQARNRLIAVKAAQAAVAIHRQEQHLGGSEEEVEERSVRGERRALQFLTAMQSLRRIDAASIDEIVLDVLNHSAHGGSAGAALNGSGSGASGDSESSRAGTVVAAAAAAAAPRAEAPQLPGSAAAAQRAGRPPRPPQALQTAGSLSFRHMASP